MNLIFQCHNTVNKTIEMSILDMAWRDNIGNLEMEQLSHSYFWEIRHLDLISYRKSLWRQWKITSEENLSFLEETLKNRWTPSSFWRTDDLPLLFFYLRKTIYLSLDMKSRYLKLEKMGFSSMDSPCTGCVPSQK